MRPDGLYRVSISYLCAGFVIENQRLVLVAPILRKKIRYWLSIAERIGD